ncbi:Aste57867_615 [Aphanomyces stellatus]|uniref:Aste57867_615 protein n=1 Tax=Aphanomyces stellatus TaxID=120398 RepID=A0A485K384_9STRA|nr:hypothetical protein As57867_000614 [Aphanomyces stellatus]VFT77840.1 Aste57867_615 [Aphanomyces stellatus]
MHKKDQPDPRRRLLPPEVLVKIACGISHAATLFSFLDALGSSNVRRSLEPLWQLSLTIDRTMLWPILQLSQDLMDSPESRGQVEAVIKFYTNVDVSWAGDMAWLLSLLQPPIAIKWSATPPMPAVRSNDWFAKWVSLPIRDLDLTRWYSCGGSSTLDAYLPRFSALESLTLKSDYTLDTVFALAAQPSSKLVELDIVHANELFLTSSMLESVILWLQTAPIRVFHFRPPIFHPSVDSLLQETYYKALFQCPMKQLRLVSDEWSKVELMCFPLRWKV